MFTTTPEQEYILFILQKTKFMRRDQAIRLLSTTEARRNAGYTAHCLDQLRHIRKIKWTTEDVFALPIMYMEPVDEEMLAAIDIMLDLTDSGIATPATAAPPYKLCFLSGREKKLGSYAVIIVRPGMEAMVTALLCGTEPNDRTVIFLLSELSQKEDITTALPHFFAIQDGGKYRYFRGVMPR